MTIDYDKYMFYGDEIHHRTIEVPDDTMVVELHWSKFGKKLVKYKDVADPSDDMYCHDYYIAFHISNTDREEYENDLLDYIDWDSDYIFINQGDNDDILLIRLYSCDITTENFKFHTLEDLNCKISFENQFYVETTNKSHLLDKELDNIKTKMGEYTVYELIDAVDALKQYEDIEVFYYHPIELTEGGIWTQVVGVHHQYSFAKHEMNDIIHHEQFEIDRLKEFNDDWSHNKIRHLNLGMKIKYYNRISDIIHQ